MEECTLVRAVFLRHTQQGVLIGEDRPILSDDVEQVNTTRFYRLGDVVVGCNQHATFIYPKL